MNRDGVFYLYFYPIISSIVAGIIFWVIFSVIPAYRRNKSISIGINNDLFKLNNALFHYFDIFLKFQKHSPATFQHKIHSCSLSEEDINIALQNKVLNQGYLFDKKISGRLLVIGEEISEKVVQIDEIIKRLYAFNLFLAASEIKILRDIHEKIFRYSLSSEAESVINGISLQPINPSLSYMTKVLLELQDDYKKLRQYVFKNQIIERQFIISKTQWLFYQNNFNECIRICKKWIKEYPYDSELQLTHLVQSYLGKNKNNIAYQLIEKFLSKEPNIVSHRQFFYPLLSDSAASSLILRKYGPEKVEEMKIIVNKEKSIEKEFIASNSDLKRYYTEKRSR